MPLDFPNSPNVNDIYTSGTRSWKWDGVSWGLVASGIVGPGVASGGTSGQVLVKNSSTDYDTSWSSSPSKMALGRVLSTSTTTQTNSGGLTSVGLTLPSYTYSNARWYEITVSLHLAQFTQPGANTISVYIWDTVAAASVYTLPQQVLGATDIQAYHATVVTNSLSGTKTLEVATTTSGNSYAVGNGTARMALLIKDIGPV